MLSPVFCNHANEVPLGNSGDFCTCPDDCPCTLYMCQGARMRNVHFREAANMVSCDRCRASGEMSDGPCYGCEGTGLMPVDLGGNMNANEYQRLTRETALYPGIGGGTPTPEQIERLVKSIGLVYCSLALNGEAGEAAEVIKKYIRDGKYDPESFKKELGDVAWYLARAAEEAGFTLSEIFEANIQKLKDRKNRGVVQGAGDNR